MKRPECPVCGGGSVSIDHNTMICLSGCGLYLSRTQYDKLDARLSAALQECERLKRRAEVAEEIVNWMGERGVTKRTINEFSADAKLGAMVREMPDRWLLQRYDIGDEEKPRWFVFDRDIAGNMRKGDGDTPEAALEAALAAREGK